MSLSKTKLLFWAKNKYNVCFSGKHGVGKTAQVKEIFNEMYGDMGTDWLYFSASSMDPWVDFVGVPKEKVAEDGITYLSLVRPEVFARDQVKALFIDEFNRAPKKVRNSVMELLQFGSINGHKFNSLEVIWTAINPSDEENTYDVEEIDPAQLDRFHVFVEIPYSVSKPYFVSKYGKDVGTGAVEWWNGLPQSVKDRISPRRLDYVLDCHSREGDIRDVLPKEANAKQLLAQLSHGSIKNILKSLYDEKNTEEIKKKFTDHNFIDIAIDHILKKDYYASYFIEFIPAERFVSLLSDLSVAKVKSLLNSIGKSDVILQRVDEVLYAKSIKGAKSSALRQWKVKNYPPVPVVNTTNSGDSIKNAKNVFWEKLIGDSETENTYERRSNVVIASSKINKNKSPTKEDAVLYYSYIFTAYRRSHGYTCGSFNKNQVSKAIKKCQKVYSLEDFTVDYKFDMDLVDKIVTKMHDSTVISAALRNSVIERLKQNELDNFIDEQDPPF